MRIVRLEIQQRTSSRSIQITKQAVSLDTKNQYKIKHFINHVKKICNLNQGQWQLTIDGFAISQNDKSKILREHVVYRLRQKYLKSKNTKRPRIKQAKPQSQQDENASADSLQEEQLQVNRQINIPQKKNARLSKIRAKQYKMNSKKKQSSSSLSSSSSDSDSSVSSDSSDSESQQKHIVTNPVKSNKPKRKSASAHRDIEKSDKKQRIKNRPEINKKIKNNTVKQIQPLINEQSSDLSQSQELPKIAEIKKVNLHPQSKPSVQQKQAKTTIIAKKTEQKIAQPQQNGSKLKLFKKEIIQGSSSEQSDDTPVKAQNQANKKQINSSQKNAQSQLQSKQIQQDSIKPKIIESKLPPALRNKYAKKSFQQHKKTQWLAVDKQKLKKWQQKGFLCFSQAKNKIRFKIIQLDEQRFIPVKSDWISGQVKQIGSDGKIYLINVTQQGQKFRPQYELYEHNMDELQIYRLLASKQQLQCLEDAVTKQNNQTNSVNEPTSQNVGQQNTETEGNSKGQDKNSVQKFICGQVHFYFSDKNYTTDLYMQMHANRHPEKYLSISFLLNFPKIKKILRDQNKLLQYLKEDPKYDQRNYQIDFVQKIIRKKIPKVEPPPPQKQQTHEATAADESLVKPEVKSCQNHQQVNQ